MILFRKEFTDILQFTLNSSFEQLDNILFYKYDSRSGPSNVETNTLAIPFARLIPLFESVSQALIESNNEILKQTFRSEEIDSFSKRIYEISL